MNRQVVARELALVARDLTAGGIKRWLEDISVEMGLEGEITKAVMKEAEKRMKKIKVKKGSREIAGSDETNPQFLFSTTHTSLLLKLATGRLNAKKLAAKELAARGLGKRGEPVQFDEARKIWKVSSVRERRGAMTLSEAKRQANAIIRTHRITNLEEAWSYLVDDRSHGDEFVADAANDVYAELFRKRPGSKLDVSPADILKYVTLTVQRGSEYLEETG